MARVEDPAELEKLYQEIVLDHYRNPRNQGVLDAPDLSAEASNPLCGDEVAVQARVDGDCMAQVKTHVKGCAIIKASSSMMSEFIQGKSIDEAKSLATLMERLMFGKALTPDERQRLSHLDALAEVRKFPMRTKCVLLPWMALEQGVKSLRGR